MLEPTSKIVLDNKDLEIEINKEFYPNFEGVVIPIAIGSNNFEVTLSGKELDAQFKKFDIICECDYETIEGIVALKKLTKLLEIGLDVTFSSNSITG